MKMNNRRLTTYALMGGASSLALYMKFLLSLRLSTNAEDAVFNGYRILNTKGKILAFTAHPDDLEIFMGGTLKQLADKGLEIHIVDVTDGEKGTQRQDLAHIRKKEQKQAASILGLKNIHFLHLPDMHLKEVNNLESILEKEINTLNPDMVFTFDYKQPFRAIKHPDHIEVGRVVDGIVKKQEKDRKRTVVYYATRRPNAVIGISDVLNAKIDAIQAHESQLRFGPKPYDVMTKSFARYSTVADFDRFAETFRVEK